MPAYVSHTWGSGEAVEAANLNAFVRDPLDRLQPSTAQVRTTNATPATIAAVAVPQNAGVLMYGHVYAARDDYSAVLHARFGGFARRATGNVALAHSYSSVHEDSVSAPTIAVSVDTSAQTIRVQVTGVASQNWDWEIVWLQQPL